MFEICKLGIYPQAYGGMLWVRKSLLKELGIDPSKRASYAVYVESRTVKGIKCLVVKPSKPLEHDDVELK